MITIIHFFSSRKQAEQARLMLGRQTGNGGKECYSVDWAGAMTHRGIFSLRFNTHTFAQRYPGIAPPNPDILSGWIRGYLYAVKSAKRTLKQLEK